GHDRSIRLSSALFQASNREYPVGLTLVGASPTLPPSMKFAFSTLCTPTWDFATIAARAKEYGYDGVEVRGFLNESILTASNIFLSEPRKVREIFKEQNIAVACLSSSIAFTANRRRDTQSAQDLMMFIDTARQLDCPLV